jgi:hypothetical protein
MVVLRKISVNSFVPAPAPVRGEIREKENCGHETEKYTLPKNLSVENII